MLTAAQHQRLPCQSIPYFCFCALPSVLLLLLLLLLLLHNCSVQAILLV
jgi:hypothetical protein